MTMDLIRSQTPPTARTWRYWARVWTLQAITCAVIGLCSAATEPDRWRFWGVLLSWALICTGVAKLVWAGAHRRS